MATAADIVASVRAATGQVYTDGSGPVTDAQILLWANEEYPSVRRMIAKIDSDLFATVVSGLVVATGATEIDVSSITGLDVIFEVNHLEGQRYRQVDPAGLDPEGSPRRVWRRRGMAGAGTAVELYPQSLAPGTYQLRYLALPAALSGTGAVLLPGGFERILVEATAARVLDRLERDYSARLRARDLALKELGAQLGVHNFVVRSSRG